MSPTAPIALWLGLPFLVVVGCGADKGTGEAAGSSAGELTYYADTKQILDAKCATCHRPGDIGPFPLTAYAEVRDFEAAVRSSIENNTMPPWKPSDDCNEYIGNIDLSAEERSTLLAWLESGAPAGDPADAPSQSGGSSFEDWTADLTLQLPEPYTPQLEPDDYRCQLIPWPYEEPVYVTRPARHPRPAIHRPPHDRLPHRPEPGRAIPRLGRPRSGPRVHLLRWADREQQRRDRRRHRTGRPAGRARCLGPDHR